MQQELHHLGLLGDDGQVQRRLRTGTPVTRAGPIPAPLTHSPGRGQQPPAPGCRHQPWIGETLPSALLREKPRTCCRLLVMLMI